MNDEHLPDPKREHRYSLMINWSDTNNAFLVSIPELHARTHGNTLHEAIEMAKDLIECQCRSLRSRSASRATAVPTARTCRSVQAGMVSRVARQIGAVVR